MLHACIQVYGRSEREAAAAQEVARLRAALEQAEEQADERAEDHAQQMQQAQQVADDETTWLHAEVTEQRRLRAAAETDAATQKQLREAAEAESVMQQRVWKSLAAEQAERLAAAEKAVNLLQAKLTSKELEATLELEAAEATLRAKLDSSLVDALVARGLLRSTGRMLVEQTFTSLDLLRLLKAGAGRAHARELAALLEATTSAGADGALAAEEANIIRKAAKAAKVAQAALESKEALEAKEAKREKRAAKLAKREAQKAKEGGEEVDAQQHANAALQQDEQPDTSHETHNDADEPAATDQRVGDIPMEAPFDVATAHAEISRISTERDEDNEALESVRAELAAVREQAQHAKQAQEQQEEEEEQGAETDGGRRQEEEADGEGVLVRGSPPPQQQTPAVGSCCDSSRRRRSSSHQPPQRTVRHASNTPSAPPLCLSVLSWPHVLEHAPPLSVASRAAVGQPVGQCAGACGSRQRRSQCDGGAGALGLAVIA